MKREHDFRARPGLISALNRGLVDDGLIMTNGFIEQINQVAAVGYDHIVAGRGAHRIARAGHLKLSARRCGCRLLSDLATASAGDTQLTDELSFGIKYKYTLIWLYST